MASYPSYPAQTPQDAPRKSRAGRIALFVGLGIVIVLLGIGGAAYALAGRFFSAQRNTPALLPADTQLYVSINPNLSAYAGAKRLQEAYQQTDPEAVDDFNKQLEDQLGVNFKDDIQPWLGLEMAFAVSGLKDVDPGMSDAAALSKDANATVLLASTDNTKAEQFLAKVRSKAETERQQTFNDEDYKGTNITINQGDEGGSINGAYAIVRDNVVLASNAQLIKDMIDRNGSTQNTLAESADYKATIAGLPNDGIGYLYIAGEFLRTVTQKSFDEQLNNLPVDSSALRDQVELQRNIIGAFQGIGVALSVPAEGVQFDTAVKFDAAKLNDKAKAQFAATRVQVSDALLKGIASDALGVYAVPLPDTLRTQLAELIKSLPDADQQIAALEEQFDINLEKDVLSWISGELAVVIMPGDAQAQGSLSSAPVTGYLVLRSKDMPAAEQGLGKIAKALETVADIQFTAQDVGGAQWQTVSDPESSDVLGGYGFINNAVVFGFGQSAMSAAAGANSKSLVDDTRFKAAQSKSYSPTGALLYADVQDAITSAAEFQGQTRAEFDATEAGKALKPIESIQISGEPGVSEAGMLRGRLFVAVTPESK